jgi:hypothetical protein
MGLSKHKLVTPHLKALFTSGVFKGIGRDYFVSQEVPDGLFTRPVLKGRIPGYPHKSPPH